MKWPYGQFLGLAAFEPCENSRGAIIKEGNEVGEANEGMDFLPINAANPFTVKVFRGHLFGICSGGVFQIVKPVWRPLAGVGMVGAKGG